MCWETSLGYGKNACFSTKNSYRALREHPVPLAESALRAIGPRSMVIDIYIWLCYRLHALRRQVEVGWAALHGQFGAGYSRLRDFRADFIAGLELAVAVYPDARVSIGDHGVIMRPSPPAVSKAEAKRIGLA